MLETTKHSMATVAALLSKFRSIAVSSAKDHPDDATKRGGVVFFAYLQKDRSDLLDFHAVGGDKWATVHGWLYYTGRVKD